MTDFVLPDTWDREGCNTVGFRGFLPLLGLDIALLPPRRGIYMIFAPEDMGVPVFLDENPLTIRPAYATDRLRAKWLPNQTVVYIGKADGARGLADRLGAFSRQSSNHSGGRALWQLERAPELLAAWVETPDDIAETVEKSYLRAFIAEHGRFPFANWRH
ncbi:hypothetical protein [Mycetocola spongiae]|uniref:hypothetical protein n=1 Tax=Mycetocola spongiae TaxID=2859226 RepID=UPI001CF24945|nr:hypothetical protein [Mycetocola spongiae]UCR89165.1 hypothetical protein KXZ72_00140 [Mycetocola spongiae]